MEKAMLLLWGFVFLILGCITPEPFALWSSGLLLGGAFTLVLQDTLKGKKKRG